MSTISANNETRVQTQVDPHKRGCLFYVGHAIKWFVIILVTLVLLGVAYQFIATELDKRAYAPRGQLYNVNGHQMHLVCMGEGSPAVILQAGASAESLWWYQVQNQLAEHTQVCAYDRPGMGWSEPVNEPRDALTIDAELHVLLEQAGVPAPYVMAGHSWGAILTRIYAVQYPQEIAGIILVDSQPVIPKHFANPSDFDGYLSFFNATHALTSALTRVGLFRLIQSTSIPGWGYPPDITLEIIGLQSRSQVMDTYYAENGPAFPALQEASAAAENLGDLPMVVLWASLSPGTSKGIAADSEELASYSTNSVVREVVGADHGSILGNEQHAQQVSDAILDVIESATTGEALKNK